jgi:hypothetical protein
MERAAAEDAARRKAEEEARIAAEKAEAERKLANDLETAQNIVNGDLSSHSRLTSLLFE